MTSRRNEIIRMILRGAVYALLAASGVFTLFAAPSSSLVRQGGHVIALIWSLFCLVGGLLGFVGRVAHKRLPEVLGATLAATACLTWCTSLILQAVSTKNTAPLTAACMAASLAAMFALRWFDVVVSRGR
jgi:uncharacterized membrane protein YeiH